MATKWVYFFGEGTKDQVPILGGKGANLSEMVRIGLPIPLGYTLTCQSCIAFQDGNKWPAGLEAQVDAMTARLQADTGKSLGDGKKPLLLSIRSGAAVSMPGMMDTVLNLGLNDAIVEQWIRATGNERFCLDSYRRFIQMYSDVVVGIHKSHFRELLDNIKIKHNVKNDHEVQPAQLRTLVTQFKALYQKETGKPFPTDPVQQLKDSITAVFKSWNNPRAIKYRDLNGLSHTGGTAVNVQAMVYGNLNNDSGTGVAFTRNPSTGENKRYGEYLMNAQGEDVVAGVRTPETLESMRQALPSIHAQLNGIFETLENHMRDMQDIEFTIEDHKLYILQTRNGKRTAPAALKMAIDMYNSGFITAEKAVTRVTPTQLEQLLHKKLDDAEEAKATTLCKGLPASPGAAVGQIVFDADRAVEEHGKGNDVILVRLETSPDDIHGMATSKGVLTARGGMTSHAAVVARGMNLCCVAGVPSIQIDEEKKTIVFKLASGDVTMGEGDWLSMNGTKGVVYSGKLGVVNPKVSGDFGTFLNICDTVATMDVYANADTPHDANVSLGFGAKGIGLVRTEHMFFAPERLRVMQEMIVAASDAGRQTALNRLLPFQTSDFEGILKVMNNRPVVIRLLDPPLHEFLPHAHDKEAIAGLAQRTGVSVQAVEQKVAGLQEVNPMLGFRGCRLAIVYPEITAMQATAIFSAAVTLKKQGLNPRPRIEVPLVGSLAEFKILKTLILQIAKSTGAEGKIDYEIGTMIETPRAALCADELATEAQFMSFGTNDLTQMTCGFSRDDAGTFLGAYVAKDIYQRDPFQSIDGNGVAKLMKLTCEMARAVKPSIDLGICGEHGGEPNSIAICQQLGLNNISCSPYRVPVARLAAAQAAVKYGGASQYPSNLVSKLLLSKL